MMLAGSLLIGFTVILIAIWLEYNDSIGWPIENLPQPQQASPKDERYRIVRRRWRRVVHLLIATCGALMASAGLAGPGAYWVAAWTAVALLMMTIIVLALGDALRTHRHYASKLTGRRGSPDRDLPRR